MPMPSDHTLEMNTHFSIQRIKHLRQDLEDMQIDRKREIRVSYGVCHSCFYLTSTISGQAFTQYECYHCGHTYDHPNTSVPKLCAGCGEELKKCRRCLADLEEVAKEARKKHPAPRYTGPGKKRKGKS